jgi:replication factor C subunit 1
VCKKVFSKEDHKTMSFYDKSDLYFYDYNMAGLFVQENYLQAKPAAAGGDKKKLMELVSKAADSIAQGDLVEKCVRSGTNWGLLPTAAVFCSVVPGEYMSGKNINVQILFYLKILL